jgi:hypothetical protein
MPNFSKTYNFSTDFRYQINICQIIHRRRQIVHKFQTDSQGGFSVGGGAWSFFVWGRRRTTGRRRRADVWSFSARADAWCFFAGADA